jgi:hypothetical protein
MPWADLFGPVGAGSNTRNFKRRERYLKGTDEKEGGERARRIRSALEAALSDIVLLATAEHVRLAARQLASGRNVETAGRPAVEDHDWTCCISERMNIDLNPGCVSVLSRNHALALSPAPEVRPRSTRGH